MTFQDHGIDFQTQEPHNDFAVDIGGSLFKLAYYSRRKNAESPLHGSGQLHFAKFETKNIRSALEFIKTQLLSHSDQPANERRKLLFATGGGAHKYQNLIETELGLKVQRLDEMECLIVGLNFLLREVPNESFTYDLSRENPCTFDSPEGSVFPYLLVNVGSGVSMLKVAGPNDYERIGGTSLGGGTFWGLCSQLTEAKCFDEMLDLANAGDHRNVDMLVGDIFGGDYTKIGLTSDTIASTFGKAVRGDGADKAKLRDADMAKSLLQMISNNIGQIAYLQARLHGVKRIYFGGFFLRGQPHTMDSISQAIRFWSKDEIKAHFLRHEGYLGSIGAFMKSMGPTGFAESGSWLENFTSADKDIATDEHGRLTPTNPGPDTDVGAGDHKRAFLNEFVGVLEQTKTKFAAFPFLPGGYEPDVVDLHNDKKARDFWMDLFTRTTDRWVQRAYESQLDQAGSKERAERFREKFLAHINILRQEPSAYGNLSVRMLFDLRQSCLIEFGFVDPYEEIKRRDNDLALASLPAWLAHLDAMSWETRQVTLIDGVLAGNMWDYDASGVQHLLADGKLTLHDAIEKIRHPFLIGTIEAWLERIRLTPHQKAVIFVDNSGPDTIMGVLPFAREMLRRGTHVILAANTHPTVNDMTYTELIHVCEQASRLDPDILGKHLRSNTLRVMETGTALPCLDLRRIDIHLAQECETVDLIVLVGMGRTVHTNLHTRFRVDSLKLAILKSAPLAEALGGQLFDVICLYEPVDSPDGKRLRSVTMG